jgi:hypothetical protein
MAASDDYSAKHIVYPLWARRGTRYVSPNSVSSNVGETWPSRDRSHGVGKAPSATAPGRFDYRVSCIIDESGDEVNSVVTAATDEEAIELPSARAADAAPTPIPGRMNDGLAADRRRRPQRGSMASKTSFVGMGSFTA